MGCAGQRDQLERLVNFQLLASNEIPPITTLPAWVAALQTATARALDTWGGLANLHPQFNPASAQITTHVVPVKRLG